MCYCEDCQGVVHTGKTKAEARAKAIEANQTYCTKTR